MPHDSERMIDAAQRVADEVLFPQALDADAAGTVPEGQLQVLADEGFYALSTWAHAATLNRVVEILAGGCLTTTFVWMQHLGTAAAANANTGAVGAELAQDLASGRLRGGVSFAHMLRSGPPMTTATPVEGGWELTGTAPWVTGWGHVDVVRAASRSGPDIVWTMIDAKDSPTLIARPLAMAAVDSSQTVELEYRGHFVPLSRVDTIENFDAWRDRYSLGLRTNGSLALGVASRCCRLLEDEVRHQKLDVVRRNLDSTDPADRDAMSRARAQASRFAVDCAAALVAWTGGRAVLLGDHAQRLMREAMFVLVQGQTPAIKHELTRPG